MRVQVDSAGECSLWQPQLRALANGTARRTQTPELLDESFEYVHSLGTRFYASRHCSATNASLGGKFPQYAFPGAARAAELAGGRRDFQCSPPDGP